MRLDKFLKVTGIIKRRTIATELCQFGNVVVNGNVKKASYEVSINDEVEVKYFNNTIKFKVLLIPPKQIKSEDAIRYINIQ